MHKSGLDWTLCWFQYERHFGDPRKLVQVARRKSVFPDLRVILQNVMAGERYDGETWVIYDSWDYIKRYLLSTYLQINNEVCSSSRKPIDDKCKRPHSATGSCLCFRCVGGSPVIALTYVYIHLLGK